MVEPIPFLSPTFPDVDDIAADYAAILKRGVFSNQGPVEQELARSIGLWIGESIETSLVSSGTAGIELAMRATFDNEKSSVLVASFTFAAGPLAIKSCGYDPVFIDIDPRSWQPSLPDAEAFLAIHSHSTAGILLTNTFGVANDEIGLWEALASRYGIALVIDSAAGFGSQYDSGERLGARGTCEVFSLHATKTLAVGEGGMITSRDPELIERFDRMKNFGFDRFKNATELGTNAKLSELSCAIGVRSLAALAERLEKRRQLFHLYRSGLSELDFDFQPLAQLSALPFISALLPSSDARMPTVAGLTSAGVESRMYYNPPIHQHRVFADSALATPSLSTTSDVASRIVSLPLSDHLKPSDVAHIVDTCRKAQ